jgi:hypothetical protein
MALLLPGEAKSQVEDTTAPTLTALSVSPSAVDVSAGPQTVRVSATITDDLSGVASASVEFRSPSGGQSQFPFLFHTSGDEFAASIEIPQFAEAGTWRPNQVGLRDNAGNARWLSNADLQAMGIDVTLEVTAGDATPPAIAITTPPEGATYALGSVVKADYTCQDPGGAGVASCVGDVADGARIDTGSIGTKRFTVTATDGAGNTSRLTHEYTVVYAFSGFFAPVANPPAVNVVRAGLPIPVRFGLGGFRGLDIFAAGYPRSERIACGSSTEVEGVEPTLPPGSSGLAYNPLTRRYIYLWTTRKAWKSTCRQLVVKLKDGTFHRANFKFR